MKSKQSTKSSQLTTQLEDRLTLSHVRQLMEKTYALYDQVDKIHARVRCLLERKSKSKDLVFALLETGRLHDIANVLIGMLVDMEKSRGQNIGVKE